MLNMLWLVTWQQAHHSMLTSIYLYNHLLIQAQIVEYACHLPSMIQPLLQTQLKSRCLPLAPGMSWNSDIFKPSLAVPKGISTILPIKIMWLNTEPKKKPLCQQRISKKAERCVVLSFIPLWAIKHFCWVHFSASWWFHFTWMI